MGQTGAEYGSASTKGLVDRAVRRIDEELGALPVPNMLNRGMIGKRRKKLQGARDEIVNAFSAVLADEGSEEELRKRLGRMLSPSFKRRRPL